MPRLRARDPGTADPQPRSIADAIDHAFAHVRADAFGDAAPTDCIPGAFGEPITHVEYGPAHPGHAEPDAPTDRHGVT